MNTEELKIIMDALVSLGEAGKTGFIWWLILKYGLQYLTIIIFLVGGFMSIRYAIYKITALSDGNQLAADLQQILAVGGGREWRYESYRQQLRAEIVNKVKELAKLSNP